MATLWDNLFSGSVGAAAVAPVVSDPPTVASSGGGASIFDQAVLLSLTLSSFGSSRKLADAEYQVDADKGKTRATKRLLDSKELKAIRQYDAETRQMVAARTLPSQFRAGLYVLPLASLQRTDDDLLARVIGRAALVDNLCSAFPQLKFLDSLPADQGGLGGCFRESDYPTIDELRSAFGMQFSYTEFSAPGRVRAISRVIYERESAKASEVWRSAIEEGKALLRAQFVGLIEHMSERLQPGADGKPKKFKHGLVDNLSEFLQEFNARNLAGDTETADLVSRAAALLDGVTPEQLRSSDTVKARVAAGVDSIKSALDAMIVSGAGRKFDFTEDL